MYQKQQQEKLADLGRKQLETVMQQLQEQLQLNLIQQSQLMQHRTGNSSSSSAEKRKSQELVATLAGQQQQLMQQLQLTQRHYLIGLQQQHLLTSPPASAGIFLLFGNAVFHIWPIVCNVLFIYLLK